MGWVIFGVAVFLLWLVVENPLIGIPLLLLVLAGIVWYFYSGSNSYREKKRRETVEQAKHNVTRTINANLAAVNRMANGALFKQLKSDVWAFNKAAYARAAESQCTYNYRPMASKNMLEFPTLSITSTRVRGARTITLDEYGFKDLSEDQIQLLGMAMVKYGSFNLHSSNLEQNKMDFSSLEADWNYWKPIVENYINLVYNKKRNEYERTHKSVY